MAKHTLVIHAMSELLLTRGNTNGEHLWRKKNVKHIVHFIYSYMTEIKTPTTYIRDRS